MLEIALMGRPSITLDKEPVTDFVSEKALLLLCYLAMHPAASGHARTTLATLFWGEMADDRARANLRMALYNLQKLLPGFLQADRKKIGLKAGYGYWLDVTEFEGAMAQKEPAVLATAVALYRGEFLQGMALDDAPELEEWLRLQRESLRLGALNALDKLAHYYTVSGAWDAAIVATRRLLAIEPWREASHRALMRLLVRTRQFNAALTQYGTCRDMLQAELGVQPMAETTAVYQRIQNARQRKQQHHLPPQPTPLVGRAAELGRLFALLNDEERRLITLAGPGGSGKTRLALAAAEAHAYAFLDGISFVPLASVTSAAGLASALANALDLTLTGKSEDQTQLIDYLRNKEMLLVLDNVEQILEPAAELVTIILESAAKLTLLVTSREYLRLRWETRFRVSGLPVPSSRVPAAKVAEYDSVQLFVQVGKRVRPEFELQGQETAVAALCGLVEGVPLAIELAAALLDQETPQQLLAQVTESIDRLATPMRDVPSRHRSLRAVFDHSWMLLTAAEQAGFARLALFRGGCSARAAAAVADASRGLLADLAAKSLLRDLGNGRYELHEVLRHHALLQLRAGGQETAVAQRHAAYFTVQLREAERALNGSGQTDAALKLRADMDNIQAAWQTAVSAGDYELLLPAAAGLTRFYQVAGLFQAGEAAFASATTALAVDVPASARAALLVHHAAFLVELHDYDAAITAVREAFSLGIATSAGQASAHLNAAKAYFRQGEHKRAQERIDQALLLAADAGKPVLKGQCRQLQGALAEAVGDYAVAESALQQALEHYREIGDVLGLAHTYQSLGTVYFRRNEYKAAKKVLEEALAVRRQIDPTGLSSARVLVNLGSVTYNLGETETARGYFQDVVEVFQQVGDRFGEGLAADMLGRMAAFASEFDLARAYYERALKLRRAINHRKGVADVQRHMADLAMSLGDYGRAMELLTTVCEAYKILEDRRSYGSTLAGIALVHHYQGDNLEARQQAEAALAVAEELDNLLLRGYALKNLGHALRGQGEWVAATAVYQEAIAVWQRLETPDVAAELQAALATVHLALGDPDEAFRQAAPAIYRLQQVPLPDCDAPGTLYHDCVTVLQKAGDPRAFQLIKQAQAVLKQSANSIADERLRRTYLEDVAAHRRLLALVA